MTSKRRRLGRPFDVPKSWENWRAAADGAPSRGSAEFALYTDCHCTNDMKNPGWPYLLINTVPVFDDMVGAGDPGRAWRRQPQPLALRIHDHLEDPSSGQAWVSLQNSDMADEVSALLSLALGRRFQAGGVTRVWGPETEPEGQPYEFGRVPPDLPQGRGWSALRLPNAREPVDLSAATQLMKLYPTISAEAAEALLRTARAYQGAIWVAEGDPAEAWLRLVSAVEAAAGFSMGSSMTDSDALKEYMPQLYALLESHG